MNKIPRREPSKTESLALQAIETQWRKYHELARMLRKEMEEERKKGRPVKLEDLRKMLEEGNRKRKEKVN